jgi:tRNA-Thr(GGU) m(6)t(6)A37 methyltransferase TsaA
MKPIAHFKSPFTEKFGIPRQAGLAEGVRGYVVFEPEFRSADAIRGLEGFDYIWLIWGFSASPESSSFQATVRPPRLGGNERVGVFASRSPFRPNGLGLSSVKIASIMDGPVIEVLGADLMDGTPIYDIKPYVTYADSHPEARSGFVDAEEWKSLKVSFPSEAGESGADLEALRQVLSLDPRPSYHDDPSKVYGMKFGEYDVRFKVDGDTLTVLELKVSN